MTFEIDFAHSFAAGLLRPSYRAPSGLLVGIEAQVETRYNVYRNNVTVSLMEALAVTYPAVQRITGPEFFRAMVRFYVRAQPPTSPLLFDYGRGFPGFVSEYEYAQEMPWLPDVARIERSWLDAYHSADEQPLSKDAFASLVGTPF